MRSETKQFRSLMTHDLYQKENCHKTKPHMINMSRQYFAYLYIYTYLLFLSVTHDCPTHLSKISTIFLVVDVGVIMTTNLSSYYTSHYMIPVESPLVFVLLWGQHKNSLNIIVARIWEHKAQFVISLNLDLLSYCRALLTTLFR